MLRLNEHLSERAWMSRAYEAAESMAHAGVTRRQRIIIPVTTRVELRTAGSGGVYFGTGKGIVTLAGVVF